MEVKDNGNLLVAASEMYNENDRHSLKSGPETRDPGAVGHGT